MALCLSRSGHSFICFVPHCSLHTLHVSFSIVLLLNHSGLYRTELSTFGDGKQILALLKIRFMSFAPIKVSSPMVCEFVKN